MARIDLIDSFDEEAAGSVVIALGRRHIVRIKLQSSIDTVGFLQRSPDMIISSSEAAVGHIELVRGPIVDHGNYGRLTRTTPNRQVHNDRSN